MATAEFVTAPPHGSFRQRFTLRLAVCQPRFALYKRISLWMRCALFWFQDLNGHREATARAYDT